jgi:hypothetical protein
VAEAAFSGYHARIRKMITGAPLQTPIVGALTVST